MGSHCTKVCTHPAASSQVLPFASEETVVVLERNLAALGPVSRLLQDGLSPCQIATRLLGELEAPQDKGFSLEPR